MSNSDSQFDLLGRLLVPGRLLGDIIGFFDSLFSNEGQDPFIQLGSPEDVSQVNPFTSNFMNTIMQGMGGAGGINQLMTGIGSTPESSFNQFFNLAPQLQGLALGATSPLAASQFALADALGQEGIDQVFSQFSNQNAARSGAAFEAATEAAMRPRLEALANITGAQTGLAQNLLTSALTTIPQTQLGAQGLQTQLMGSLLGAGTTIAAPEFFQPAFAENPNFLSTADILNFITGLAGAGANVMAGL